MGLRNFTLTVNRYGYTTNICGIVNTSVIDTFTIRASVQPLNGNDVVNNPALRSNSEAFYLYTSKELLPSIEGSNNSDKVVIYNEEYEVMSCERWQNKIRSHYKVLVQR